MHNVCMNNIKRKKKKKYEQGWLHRWRTETAPHPVDFLDFISENKKLNYDLKKAFDHSSISFSKYQNIFIGIKMNAYFLMMLRF